MAIAYLNGEWCQPEAAKISVLDRGFMFGDGVYEVMPVYGGQVFTLDQHLDRLDRSLGALKLESPLTREEWKALLSEAVDRSGEDPALLYLQVTRGIAQTRSLAFDDSLKPTILITVSPAPILKRENVSPYKVTTREDFRWGRGDVKVVSLVAASMIKNEVVSEGYDDAILLKDGRVTEATASNVFIVKDGAVKTPPKTNQLLGGITRDHVLDLISSSGIPLEEQDFGRDELLEADEVWITSTGHEVWPIGEIDGQTIGNGAAGVMFEAVDQLFQKSKELNASKEAIE